MAIMAKYGHFEYLVEYPIWVSIKRTLTGKLVLAGQNLIYCICLRENVQQTVVSQYTIFVSSPHYTLLDILLCFHQTSTQQCKEY